MELTPRQLETIENIAVKGIKTSEDIISYCKNKLALPVHHNHKMHPENRVPGRRHSRRYYQEIISYYSGKD